MGLNWAEGLKAAGKGVGQMAGMKMQEADYLYKEMAQQNRQRFAASESQKQRDFLAAEKQTQRDWETPFKEEGLEIQKGGQELRLEELKLQGKRYSTQEEQTNRRIQIEEGKADAATQREQRLSAAERAKEMQAEIKRLDDRRKELESKLSGSGALLSDDPNFEQNIKQELAQLDQQEELYRQQAQWDEDVIKLPKGQQEYYEQARSVFGGQSDLAHQTSLRYAKMSDAQRGQVNTIAKQLQQEDGQKYGNWKAAQAAAINKLWEESAAESLGSPSAKADKPEVGKPQVEPASTTKKDPASPRMAKASKANTSGPTPYAEFIASDEKQAPASPRMARASKMNEEEEDGVFLAASQ